MIFGGSKDDYVKPHFTVRKSFYFLFFSLQFHVSEEFNDKISYNYLALIDFVSAIKPIFEINEILSTFSFVPFMQKRIFYVGYDLI